jgi:hypothetical protein
MANNVPHANLINSIKAGGIERALFDAVSGRVWNAKMSLENAVKDGFVKFPEELLAARQALDEAEAFYREWADCSRQRQGKKPEPTPAAKGASGG